MAEAALEVQGVSYGYTRAVKALDLVSFSVPAGRFTALLGPNGAGKTTLMALVTRLFSAEAGTIRVCGHDLAHEPRAALAAMGVVFQRPTLDVDLTVEQNLRYAAALYGMADVSGRIAEVLRRMRLSERAGTKVRTLSGGMKRRVEIGRALLHRPQLLVLDEPTVGLDMESRRDLVEHVHALCRDEHLAVLWATHLIDEIAPEDRVVLLSRGKIRATGAIGEVVAAAGASDLGAAYRRLTERLAA
ncbi:MAG: ABC transporter ATP-binding protein [Geminicoccaceae bacterium]